MCYLVIIFKVWVSPTIASIPTITPIGIYFSVFSKLREKTKVAQPLLFIKDKTQQELIEFTLYCYKEVSP
jgi:hypothetical protein